VVAGQTLALDLVPLPTGTLEGQLFAADGVTPYANMSVLFQSYAGSGVRGHWSNSVGTDSAGRFRMPGVPAGTVRVEVGDSESSADIQVPVTVAAGKTTVMQASGGSGVSWPTASSGAVEFRSDNYGRLYSAALPGFGNPFYYSYRMSVNDGGYYPNTSLATVTSPGTRFEFGPANHDALIVQRKVAVPGNKPYVRFIEVIRNPTAVPLPVSVLIDAALTTVTVVTGPAETGSRYVITGGGTGSSYAMVGHVIGGAGTPAVKPGIALVPDSSFSYVWATTVPPGGTVEFMHFSVIWDPADVEGLKAQAQALVELTDPDALAGVSDEEKSRIVNFTVPGGTAALTGNIRGTLTAQDGVTPLAGATVRAQDAFTGHLFATTSTDANGAFALDNVPNGDYGVAVNAQLPGVPGESAGAAVTFSSAGQTVSGLALTFSAGEVTGLVTVSGAGSANPTVLVSQTDGLGTVTTLRAYRSDADGHFVVLGLKPGAFSVAVVDAAGQVGTTLQGWYDGTGSLTLNIDLPSLPSCVQSPSGLLGFWRGEAGAEDSVRPGSDGTLDNTAVIVPAKVGNGFGLDGNSALVQIPDNAGNLRPATITVSAWVKFNSLDSASTPMAGEQYIVFKKKGTIGLNGWTQGYALAKTRGADDLDRFAFYVVTPDEQNLWAVQTGRTPIEPGRYYHVIGTVDGTVGRLYVDGMLEATFPFPYPVDAGTGPLVIGGGDLGGWDPRLDGVIDEVQVFDRALTVGEVQALYAATSAGICADLQMLPALLPATYVGVSTTDTLRAVNGYSPVTFSSSDPPAGLSVTTGGALTGVPTTAGTFAFTATATDATSASASRQFIKTVLPCVSLPTGLVSLWSGEDNATDSMGVNNSTLEWGNYEVGKVGRAFFGYNLAIRSQTPPLDLADTFTIEFWALPYYYRTSTTESTSGTVGFPWNTTQRYAITPENRGAAGAGAGLSVGANGVSVFEHGDSGLPSTLVYDTTINDWVHIALVYQNKTPKLYVNGVFVRTGLTSLQAHVYAPKSLGDMYGYGLYYGFLDEVALYNRALTGTEIGSIFAAGGEARCATVRR
jgi:hypothetical protein